MTTIAEVLHMAADESLCYSGDWLEPGWIYSCDAVGVVARRNGYAFEDVAIGLARLGCPVESSSAFDEFPEGPERQCARYAWLKFAAMIAEEQGV